MDPGKLKAQLTEHEGRRLLPYTDTVGKLTIGVGHNLTARGISDHVCDLILDEDVVEVLVELDMSIPWWRNLSEVRQLVLADMCFNLGIGKLLKFQRTLGAMRESNFAAAADGMLDSKWAKQVGRRARRLAIMMREDREVSMSEVA